MSPRTSPCRFGPATSTDQRRVKQGLVRLWNAYWDHQAPRATAVMLYALSDRTLADIGVDPKQRDGFLLVTIKQRPRTAAFATLGRKTEDARYTFSSISVVSSSLRPNQALMPAVRLAM